MGRMCVLISDLHCSCFDSQAPQSDLQLTGRMLQRRPLTINLCCMQRQRPKDLLHPHIPTPMTLADSTHHLYTARSTLR